MKGLLLLPHDEKRLSVVVAAVQRPHSEVLWTQKSKTHLLRTKSQKVLPLKPGVGQHIVTHATPTVRDFCVANLYPPDQFTCIFPKPLLSFS